MKNLQNVSFNNVVLNFDENYTLSTKETAECYGVSEENLRNQKYRHKDEILKDIHYIEVWDNQFKRYITRWTLDGIHMLGFFIKSQRAKEFRKFTAMLLTQIRSGKAQVFSASVKPKPERLSFNEYLQEKLESKDKEIDTLKDELLEQLKIANSLLLEKVQNGRAKRRTWSKEEELKLIELYNKGLSYSQIAQKLNRTASMVSSRASVLKKRGEIK